MTFEKKSGRRCQEIHAIAMTAPQQVARVHHCAISTENATVRAAFLMNDSSFYCLQPSHNIITLYYYISLICRGVTRSLLSSLSPLMEARSTHIRAVTEECLLRQEKDYTVHRNRPTFAK